MNGRSGLGEKGGQLEKLAGRNKPQQAVAGPCLDEDMVYSVALALFPNSGETKKFSHSKVPSNTLCLGLLCALWALHRVPMAWSMQACSGVRPPRMHHSHCCQLQAVKTVSISSPQPGLFLFYLTCYGRCAH